MNQLYCASENPSRTKRMIRKAKNLKFEIGLALYCAWWRTLHALGIGWAYSRFLCRHGWYRKFPDGRCSFCGKTHAWQGVKMDANGITLEEAFRREDAKERK